MKKHIEAMVDRNVYDHIIVHSGTNGVDKLRVNDIAMNMESCVITLKRRWPNAQIALSGLTYAPKGDNTKIDDINDYYEAICSEHNITYITGGHFACACVNPLNNNSVDASNLMAGNRKLARKVAGLLKAISLVL